MQLEYTLNRSIYRGQTTIGEMFLPDGKRFGYTLEDTVRAYGIKDAGNTAIPEGRYRMIVTMSTRFKREMVMVYTESNQYELKAGGISFKGIRVHGGNTHVDTDGCILIAKNKISDQKIQGTLEKEFTAHVKANIEAGHECYLVVKNLPQAS